MTTTECLVTVHDQDLVLESERTGQFEAFDRVTYMFVGYGDVDRLPDDLSVVVCRDKPGNVEHLPQFYDFTGWWAMTRDDGLLLQCDNVVCLQYDMKVMEPRIQKVVEMQLKRAAMLAFNAGYYGPNWMLRIPGFEATYNAGLARVGADQRTWEKFDAWPSTQGTAWRTEALVAFMDWFEPLFEAFRDHTFAGHLAERSVKAWLEETDQPVGLGLGLIAHEAADCHGTGALMAGNMALYHERAASFALGKV